MNAFHNYLINTIFMSAAILQSPMMEAEVELPASITYGRAGFICGHEFTHGFESGGAEYDGDGNKKNWWTPTSRAEFERRKQSLVDLYSGVTHPRTGLKLDGQRTLSENIADVGGIRAAFNAYKRHMLSTGDRHAPGYGQYDHFQTFFIAFGTQGCDARPTATVASLMQSGKHSPFYARVNTVLANFPEFARAFQCPPGSGMNPHQQHYVYN